MLQIIFYVPEDALEKVKDAMFAAGAGQIGNYSHCAWQIKGEGQFKPLAGSNPAIGEIDKIETVIEYKVELSCTEENLTAAIAALYATHPYETPAFHVTKHFDFRH